MINTLLISNYAIIDKLEINFSKGLTIISGETGAGKSIILGALNLLLGSRFESFNFKKKEKKTIIEGHFSVSKLDLKDFFIENNLDYHQDLIIRREFLFEGNSRSFINDTPVKLELLKKISFYLVDIHSQHKNLLINNEEFQLNLLDQFCFNHFDGFSQLLTDYKLYFNKFQKTQIKINKIKHQANDQNFDLVHFKNLVSTIESLNLTSNENEKNQIEYKRLNNIHHIKSVLNKVLFVFENSDNSLIALLNQINSMLSEIDDFDLDVKKLLNRLKENQIDFNDILMDLHNVNQNLNYDPNKLEELENRINTINSLEKQLNTSSVEGILDHLDLMKKKLDDLENIEVYLKQLKSDNDNYSSTLFSLAKELTNYRKKSSIALVGEIKNDLINLGVNEPQITFDFSASKDFLPKGLDNVNLLFSANKGYDLKPVENIASGGEMARLMLCLKKYLFKIDNFSTLVFDEVDAGVSVDIGRKMGTIIKEISNQGQVICITHLAQIASLGDKHLKVLKDNTSSISVSKVLELYDEQRIQEIARMLNGDDVNQESIVNAKKMLDI